MSGELTAKQQNIRLELEHAHAMDLLNQKYWLRGQIWAGCISSAAIGGSIAALFAGANAWAVGIISTEFVALMALFLRKQYKKD